MGVTSRSSFTISALYGVVMVLLFVAVGYVGLLL